MKAQLNELRKIKRLTERKSDAELNAYKKGQTFSIERAMAQYYRNFKKIDKMSRKEVRNFNNEELIEYMFALNVIIRYHELYENYDKLSFLYSVKAKLV